MDTYFRSVLMFLYILIFIVQGHCRESGIYTISLTDKEGTPFSMDHPEAFLSSRSLHSVHQRAKNARFLVARAIL